MSYENFPEREKNTHTEVKKRNSKNILVGVLVIALLATWGYIIYDNNRKSQEKDVLTAQVVKIHSDKNELQKELNDAALRLDALKTSNAQADSLIQTK
ncbi:MAG TPA: hypothetical protein PK611_10445, partial [Saprospiraceae bacterium]|nr:hypothetical protein [Saprospiraceae bacterium]